MPDNLYKQNESTAQSDPLDLNNEEVIATSVTIDSSKSQLVRKTSGRLAFQHAYFTKKIHELRYLYALSAFLDGEILAYGSIKYYFDVLEATQASINPLRDWLLTSKGMVCAAAESAVLIGLSLIANTSNKDDPSAFKQAIMDLWPYVRNIVGALKDTSRSVRNTLKIGSLLTETNLTYMMMPAGLTVTAATVLNSIWFQRMHGQQKELKDELQALLSEIKAINIVNEGDLDIAKFQEHRAKLAKYLEKIGHQSSTEQQYAYLSAAYTGMIESFVEHLGVVILISFTSPAFIPIAACSIVFSLATIITRIYEEYEYQRSLEIDSLAIKVLLKKHELALLTSSEKSNDFVEQYGLILAEMAELQEQIDARKTSVLTNTLSDIRNGLATYMVINRVLVTSLICFGAVPTSLLIGNGVIGIALLTGFTMYALIKYCQQQYAQKNNDNNKFQALENAYFKANRILDSLVQSHQTIAAAPGSSFFRTWFVSDLVNLARVFCFGLKNGQKLMGYVLMISFLEASLHNDLQDKPIIMKLAVALGIFSAFILTLRAYTFSFGSQPKIEVAADAVVLSKPIKEVQAGRPAEGQKVQPQEKIQVDNTPKLQTMCKDELEYKVSSIDVKAQVKNEKDIFIGSHRDSFFARLAFLEMNHAPMVVQNLVCRSGGER